MWEAHIFDCVKLVNSSKTILWYQNFEEFFEKNAFDIKVLKKTSNAQLHYVS